MKRRYEQTVNGGWVELLIAETPEDLDEIERRRMRGEVDTSASFGDRRAEGAEDDQGAPTMTSRRQYRCRFCGQELLAWLPVAKRPDGAMLLNHLSRNHRAEVEVRRLLDRMRTEDIATVAARGLRGNQYLGGRLMQLWSYAIGILATVALGIFGGYASFRLSFALWMARLAIILYGLAGYLYWEHQKRQTLDPSEARSSSLARVAICTGITTGLLVCSFFWPIEQEKETQGLLLPAHDLSPPHSCPDIPSDALIVDLGTNIAFGNQFPFTVLEVAGKPLIVVDKKLDGMSVSAKVFGVDSRIIAEISHNEFYLNPNNYFRRERPDPHTLIVYDQQATKVLQIRYLNPSAVKIRGIFNFPGQPVAVVEDQFMRLRDNTFSRSCAGQNQANFSY